MLKGIKYNVNFKKRLVASKYDEEFKLLHDFSASKHENIEFEYGSDREALNATVALRKYIVKNRMSLRREKRNVG